jgi:nucleotide-binding universal stress UspA family protein
MTEQERKRVLVGVDGSAGARPALEFAAREAGLRGATLVALMAVEPPDYAWIDPYAVRSHPEAALLQTAEQRLRAILSEVDTHGIEVQPVVTTTSAAAALVERSRDADLLVVGSRGHGGFRGLVMGSVSMQCVVHAHCPVTIVRSERDAERSPRYRFGDIRRETTAPFI